MKSLKLRVGMLTSSAIAVSIAVANPAAAQDAEAPRSPSAQGDESMNEIVVTAQKREQSIIDVPISVAVLSSQDIERRSLVGMEDYLRAIPSVNLVDRGANDNSIVIRGIATSPQQENFAAGATVATYFGETSITGAAGFLGGGIDLRPVDLERIELLRGPQGTTFGSSSLAGALRLIPKAPDLDRVGAKFAASYSETARLGSGNNMVQGTINLPVIENQLAIRVVAYRFDESGVYRNIVGIDPASLAIANKYGVTSLVQGFVQDDVGQQVSTGGRIMALWRPTDRFKIMLTAMTQKVKQHGTPQATLDGYNQAQFPVPPIRRVNNEPGEYYQSNIDLYNAVADYSLPWATLTGTASWTRSGISPNLATTGSPFPLGQAAYSDVKSFTAETRIVSHFNGPFQFTVGLFYENTRNPNVNYADWLGFGVAPNPSATLGLLATDPLSVRIANRYTKQRAVFGELSYDLTDRLTITAGGRYFRYEKREYSLLEGGFQGRALGTGVPTDLTTAETNHTLKANISYKPTRDSLIYASWSQGFRLGRPVAGVSPALCDSNNDGVIDGQNVTIASTRNVDSDFLDSYEVGAKFSLFRRRLNVTAAAFHLKWDGLPITVSLPNVGTCRGTYTANVGEATSDGFEIQADLLLAKGFKITAGGSYTDAELSRDAPALRAKKGARLPGAPRFSANFGAQYDFELWSRKAFVRADSFYMGSFYGDLLQTPGLKAGGYFKVDARAGIRFDRLTAEIFAKNLTNRDDFTWRGISGGTNPFFGYRLRPRTVGIQLGYDF